MSSTVKQIKEEQAKRVGKLVCLKNGSVRGIIGGPLRFASLRNRVLTLREGTFISFGRADIDHEDDFIVQLVY